MTIAYVWITKLILAHLLTDFILQPARWVADRQAKHFASPALYLHSALTGIVAWLLAGTHYWQTALVITITHLLIDGWKSYRPQTVGYFLLDQALHLLVIAACWCTIFLQWGDVKEFWLQLNAQPATWKIITAFVFLTAPAGILIGQFTRQWRDKIDGAESLANAGKWIGIAERVIILIFVLYSQFSAIGLLVAAKGIIRFNEKDRQEIKTEYLVVGTLMSISLAIVTGLLAKA
ncbi:MAG TPA: DUF3307 domain-containing protein [Chitinophagaceae bacterium]|nr:DUF3307 domain-containing protein [Chitinophagaceae bacterium]